MEITIEQFGKDHWSLLAYVETLCVDATDQIGRIQRNRMRCNPDTHPLLSAGIKWDTKYSSRLQGASGFNLSNEFDKAVEVGVVIPGHDDWDCLDDLAKNGMVDILSLANCSIKMTGKGMKYSGKLREHKVSGGMYGNFKVEANG